jgi:hypothetical protein
MIVIIYYYGSIIVIELNFKKERYGNYVQIM